MKPLHHELTRLTRCPCCVGKYSKGRTGGANNGKSASRHQAKRQIQKELSQN